MDARAGSETERLSKVVLGSLDDEVGTGSLARRAYWSRTHFHRLFRALVEESPGAMRRRLLLERAAWELGRTQLPITEIALNAQYGSLEAFTRAFRRAYRVSPSIFRRLGVTWFRLPARSRIHFCAPGPRTKGGADMDLFDRFAGYDSWHTRRLLEHARDLADEDLDRPLKAPVKLLPWEKPVRNLRELLAEIVYGKEIWTIALTGGELPRGEKTRAEKTPAALLARFEKADAEFNRVLGEVRDRGGWDDVFVDALCDPPETFTFGGVFAHFITFNSYSRLTAHGVLRRLGADDLGLGCPTEYEESVAPWREEAKASEGK